LKLALEKIEARQIGDSLLNPQFQGRGSRGAGALMTEENEFRLKQLEDVLGYRLPASYRDFLRAHRADFESPEQMISNNPEYWGVSHLFEVGDGPSYVQVDEVFRLVGDELPKGFLPIAEDISGNLYLLDCTGNAVENPVFWWDHERNAEGLELEPVAGGFPEFLDLLVPATD
jgi:hypothetical protein